MYYKKTLIALTVLLAVMITLSSNTKADWYKTASNLNKEWAKEFHAGVSNYDKIGRAHVRTPVTEKSRMPSSA